MPAPPAAKPRVSTQPRPGQITAQGVFAELAAVRPILEAHQRNLAPKIIPQIKEEIKKIVSEIKPEIKKDPQKLEQVATDIAQEATRETLEDLGSIQDPAQIPQVLADSLTQSIVTHPDINPSLDKIVTEEPPPSADEEKIQAKAQKAIINIVKDNQPDLERAAVLKNIENIANLSQTTISSEIIDEQAAAYIHENSLPDPQGTTENIKGHIAGTVQLYSKNLAASITGISQNNIPTLGQWQDIKTRAFDQSVATVKSNISQKERPPAFEPVAQSSFALLGLKPFATNEINKIGLGQAAPRLTTFTKGQSLTNLGLSLAVTTNTRAQTEASFSLLAHDPHKLALEIEKRQEQIKKFSTQKSLSYKDRKTYHNVQKEYFLLEKADSFAKKQTVKARSYVSVFLNSPLRQRLDWTNQAWQTVDVTFNQYPGIYVPSTPTRKLPSIMPTRFFGAQAAKLGSFASTGKAAVKVGKLAGGGAIAPAMIAKTLMSPIRKIAKLAGGAFIGLGLYFLALGKIAMAGFMIGAGIGGTVGFIGGGFVGLQVAAACGPFAPACALVTVPTFAITGGIVGGLIGGAAGALIALGLASGSATMVSMGVGAGAGGTIGGVIGFNVGAGLAATAWTAAIGICIGSVVCAPFAPFMVAAGPAVVWASGFAGGIIGAAVGTFAGAYAGYLVGNYVIPGINTFAIGFKNFFSHAFGAGGAGGGLIGSGISFATGLASTLFNSFVAGAGSLLSGAFGIGSSIFGGLSGLIGTPAAIGTLAAVPVFGGIGAIVIGGTIIGITAAAAFFNPDPTSTQLVGGDNEFYTISKSAEPPSIPDNNSLPATIRFTITLQAKESRLTGISFSDQINVSGRYDSFSQSQNLSSLCNPPLVTTLEAQTAFQCRFEIEANNQSGHDYRDSQIVNTVTVRATPQNASQVQDSATAAVSIGHPPSDCPSGWPLETGYITQGPDGPTSHYNAYPAEQAIDIGGNDFGTSTIATFTGTVLTRHTDENNAYGVYVDLAGNCNGQPFSARWAHLTSIDPTIREGGQINKGERIGAIDNTGTHTFGVHLHYSTFGLNIYDFIPNAPSGIDCDDNPRMGTAPCNVSW